MGKKKKSRVKQRIESVYASVNAVDGKLEVTYDGQHNGFIFNNLVPGSLHQKTVYKRDSGKEKVLVSTPCGDGVGRFETNENLQKNFDFLFAIDTNTRIVAEEPASISVSYFVPNRLSNYTKAIPFLPFCTFEINCIVSGINPETVGWHILFEKLRGAGMFQIAKRIGVTVDSELGKLIEMNRRNIPYYESYFLPDEIQLVYASSDTGKEFIPNQMISYCDKMAKKCLDDYVRRGIQTNKTVNGDRNFRGYRVVNFKRE